MSFCLDKKKCSFSFGVVCSYKPTSKQKKKSLSYFSTGRRRKKFSRKETRTVSFGPKKKKGGEGMYYVVVIHAHICLVSLTKSPLLETTRIERLRLLFLPLCVRVCVWMDGPHWICIGWGPHWHLSTDPHANQYGGSLYLVEVLPFFFCVCVGERGGGCNTRTHPPRFSTFVFVCVCVCLMI